MEKGMEGQDGKGTQVNVSVDLFYEVHSSVMMTLQRSRCGGSADRQLGSVTCLKQTAINKSQGAGDEMGRSSAEVDSGEGY